MKKMMFAVAALALAFGISGTAFAAEIENASGQSCGADSGTWHFINNQTGGASAGQLTATWDSGDSCTVTASKTSRSTQHFFCTATGELLTASTNLPGRLVLSDFSCDTKKCEKDCK